jgi:hypothetical protein
MQSDLITINQQISLKCHTIGRIRVRDSSGKPAMQVSRRPIACGLGANSPTPLEARPNQNMAKLNYPYNYIIYLCELKSFNSLFTTEIE